MQILIVAAGLATLAGTRVGAAAEQAPAAAAAPSSDNHTQPPQEVTVTAQKLDQRRLDKVIIPRFVQSHGAPSFKSNQVSRWSGGPSVICPRTVGLKPAAVDYVSRRVVAVATDVGAPTAVYGHCKATIEIIFTADPQAQVDYFAKTYRGLLGHDGRSLKELLTVSHQIQAWYTTATAVAATGWVIDTDGPYLNIQNPTISYLKNDQEPGSASRLSVGVKSGFLNVLVIVDAKQVSEHSLRSIADYIAMLVLTRTSVDGCSELPSIVDLLSADCAGRAPPPSITTADTAYLKALYSSDLEKNLNVERRSMHDRMLQEVQGQ
ncbi:MAG TPA: hypothetical protein VGV09_18730 [Steroidobacteraceae bacterium]|nr:hypothetical protein [Steroidobacteraceae bacterium]